MQKNYKRLCVAIVAQLVDDFKKKPNMRIEIENDLKSVTLMPDQSGYNAVNKKSWECVLDAANVHYDQLTKALNMEAINAKHKLFLKAVKKLKDKCEATGVFMTRKDLASELGWTVRRVNSHSTEYGFMYLFKEEDAAKKKEATKLS